MKTPMLFCLVCLCVLAGITTSRAQGSGVAAKADSLILSGQDHAAEEMLQKAIKQGADLVSSYEVLGDLYGKNDQWKDALEAYEKALELAPGRAELHYKTGGIFGMIALENKLKALGIIDDIIFHFEKAAELDPEHLEVRWALIEFYVQLPGFLGGSFKKAFRFADQLKGINSTEGLLAYGYIEDYRKEEKKAQSYFIKAMEGADRIEEDYPRENIHYQLGKIASRYGVSASEGLRQLQLFEKKHNVYSRISLKWAYLHMAAIHKGLEQYEQAGIFLDKALAIDPDFKEARAEKRAL